MDVTNEQAAYMAGAIDGEGHVGLQRGAPDARRGRVSATFSFRIKITNTNKAWLEQLQQWFGGDIVTVHQATDRRRTCYDLRFTSTPAKSVLIRIMPYLLIKKRHAELILRYFELAATRRLFSVNVKPTDPAIIAAQEALYVELKSLNLTRKSPRVFQSKNRTCSFEGCDRKHYGKGYCWMHYRKFILRGGPAAHDKRCVVCGAEFISRRSDAECCSRKCMDKRYYAANAGRIKAQVKANKDRARRI